MSLRIERQKLLVVEGRDEERFFNAAFNNYLGLTDIQVMPIGGKTKLSASLAALIRDPKFQSVASLAIIRDADATDLDASTSAASKSLVSVSSSLSLSGLRGPSAHGEFADGDPRVGIFIVPNGIDDGMLETLCLASVSAGPEFECVNRYFECLQVHQIVPTHHHKARAHAWLASQPKPGLRVGEAADAGYWPWDSPVFSALWSFIRLLWPFGSGSDQAREHPITAIFGVAKLLDVVAHAVGQCEQQAVVRDAFVFERAAHLEIQTVAHHHERNIGKRVRIALAELVRPDD
jgi:hypothetical protein